MRIRIVSAPKLIETLRLVREVTGLSLVEAKRLLDLRGSTKCAFDVPPELKEATLEELDHLGATYIITRSQDREAAP